MSRLAVAVIGVGHLGKEHARILASMPGVDLVGVVDANPEQAEAIARKHSTTAFATHRPLLQLADAAVIAVPTAHHFPIAAEFLRCGIPLLVEKPLARGFDEATELVKLAEEGQTLLQVGHIERFNPTFEALQRLPLQPRFIRCERYSSFTGRSTDIGVVLDLMIHDLDLVLALTGGTVRGVEAMGMAIFGGEEDVADARLHMANGCVVHLTASRASCTSERSMQVWAPEGFVAVDFAKRQLKLVQPSDDVRRYGLDPRRLDPASRALLKDELFERYLWTDTRDCPVGPVDSLTRELQHFVACVRSGLQPMVSGEQGRDALAVASRILSEIRRHAWRPEHWPAPAGRLVAPPARERAA